MPVEKDFELLDDFLSNRMSEVDRSSFEEKLQADPELKEEFELQQKLVESIRNNRIAELKTFLNNTPIPPQASQSGVLTKVIGTIAVASVVATGAYFYFYNQDSVMVEESQNEQPIPIMSEDTIENNNTSNVNENNGIDKPLETSPQSATNATTRNTEDESTRQREKELVKVISSTFVTSSTEVITKSDLNNFNFHYAFEKGKLVLYGSFEPNQYQILEFITKNEHIFFLSYKSNYYLLDDQKDVPSPLVPIKDSQLRNKLREFRTK